MRNSTEGSKGHPSVWVPLIFQTSKRTGNYKKNYGDLVGLRNIFPKIFNESANRHLVSELQVPSNQSEQ